MSGQGVTPIFYLFRFSLEAQVFFAFQKQSLRSPRSIVCVYQHKLDADISVAAIYGNQRGLEIEGDRRKM